MSIWCSAATFFDDDEWDPEYMQGPGPIVYHHSNVIPDPEDRAGRLDIAYIAGHIRGRGEYVRVGISEDGGDGQTVVLDRRQAEMLVEDLTEWLSRSDEDWDRDWGTVEDWGKTWQEIEEPDP